MRGARIQSKYMDGREAPFGIEGREREGRGKGRKIHSYEHEVINNQVEFHSKSSIFALLVMRQYSDVDHGQLFTTSPLEFLYLTEKGHKEEKCAQQNAHINK